LAAYCRSQDRVCTAKIVVCGVAGELHADVSLRQPDRPADDLPRDLRAPLRRPRNADEC
jgi:hypothetical protein